MCFPRRVPLKTNTIQRPPSGARRGVRGLTLVEVLISLAIVALVFGSIIQGYVTSGKITEWSGYSLAAQSLAVETLEQVRSATWDPQMNKCEVTNIPLQGATLAFSSSGAWTNYSGYQTSILDVPWKSNNYVMATNFVNFKMVSLASNTNVQAILARVDTVWRFTGWGSANMMFYTNTVCTFFAPDNIDPALLGN
jgi:prepilin-type N-terminal cleavage/methylation domain-containing protein